MLPKIEVADPHDFLAIAALDRIAWVHTGEKYIADGEHVWRVWCQYATVLVCRHDGGDPLPDAGDVAAASVMFPTETDEVFLHKIMVHPQRRARGIGTQLMRHTLADAPKPVLLTVAPDNTAAVKLYEKFGFVIRERIDGFYRTHEDRYLMVYAPAPTAS